MIKKIIITIICIPMVLVLLFISLFFINPIINDFRLNNFAKQLKEYPLPDKTYIVEAQSVCGKLNGNGNGMDYFACILIKSELDIDKIKEHYSNAVLRPARRGKDHKVKVMVDYVTSPKVESDLIEHRKIYFEKIKKINDYSGYYYVMAYDGGYFSGFDLRGN